MSNGILLERHTTINKDTKDHTPKQARKNIAGEQSWVADLWPIDHTRAKGIAASDRRIVNFLLRLHGAGTWGDDATCS